MTHMEQYGYHLPHQGDMSCLPDSIGGTSMCSKFTTSNGAANSAKPSAKGLARTLLVADHDP